MEDAVLAPIQSAKSADYEGGSGFNAAVKPSERTTNETPDTKTGGASHGMEDPALTPVQAEPKKCTYSSSCNFRLQDRESLGVICFIAAYAGNRYRPATADTNEPVSLE